MNVHVMPFNYNLNQGTKIVGLLGHDVLAGGVFKFDYVKGTIDFYPPSTFDPASLGPVYTLPIEFDDGYAFTKGAIGWHPTDNILVDTEFQESMVFSSFADRYPDAVQTLDGKPHTTGAIPFADEDGYGFDVDMWLGKVTDIQFGPAHFVDYPVTVASDPVEADDADAVMGLDVLRYYDVYLDYPHSRIYLKPNTNFLKRFKHAE
jgi:hypothetical protein